MSCVNTIRDSDALHLPGQLVPMSDRLCLAVLISCRARPHNHFPLGVLLFKLCLYVLFIFQLSSKVACRTWDVKASRFQRHKEMLSSLCRGQTEARRVPDYLSHTCPVKGMMYRAKGWLHTKGWHSSIFRRGFRKKTLFPPSVQSTEQ